MLIKLLNVILAKICYCKYYGIRRLQQEDHITTDLMVGAFRAPYRFVVQRLIDVRGRGTSYYYNLFRGFLFLRIPF